MGPTCGMTREVMWAARGELTRAWQFNPASLLVGPMLIGLTGRAVYGRPARRWLNLRMHWRPLLWLIPALMLVRLSVR